jgi:hypothetical protein
MVKEAAMTDITNEQRAGWAAHALLQYAIGKEGGEEFYDEVEAMRVSVRCWRYERLFSCTVEMCKFWRRTEMG